MGFTSKGTDLHGGVYHLLTTNNGVAVNIDVIGFRTVMGLMFYHADFFTLPTTSTVVVAIRTGDYKLRFWWEYNLGEDIGSIECHFYKNASTTGGTNIPIFNRDLSSNNSESFIVVENPTIVDSGTEIYSFRIDATRKGRGELVGFPEFIFDKNSEYLITVANVSTSDCVVNHRYLFTEIGRWE